MERIVSLIAVAALVAYSNALTISRFENLTPGIWRAWNESNPDNVNQGRFGMECGTDNLWLVSRRLYRKNTHDPWDPASRAGIVSTLHLANNVWTHTPYNRLDEDQYGDKLFSLNGRLFMLTYSTTQKRIIYHKLFFWSDETSQWLETPFDIDPAATTLSTNSIQGLSVVAPSQTAKVAYFVASAHAYAQSGSEIVFSRLDVDFRANIPIKASLKPIARQESQDPSAVMFTAMKDDVLYAFIQNFWSEGYVSDTSLAYTVDLTTNQVDSVSLGGVPPPMEFDGNRMFQTRDDMFIVGGSQVYGLGRTRVVRDIWSLDLASHQWRGTNAMIPETDNFYLQSVAYDQQKGKLYLGDLKQGISVAQASA